MAMSRYLLGTEFTHGARCTTETALAIPHWLRVDHLRDLFRRTTRLATDKREHRSEAEAGEQASEARQAAQEGEREGASEAREGAREEHQKEDKE